MHEYQRQYAVRTAYTTKHLQHKSNLDIPSSNKNNEKVMKHVYTQAFRAVALLIIRVSAML